MTWYLNYKTLALLISGLATVTQASNGPAYSTGPVSSDNFIREATATLVVPNAPNPIVGNSVLWVGMGTSKGDLIQGINNNYPADTLRSPCSNLGGNWCVAATTLAETSRTTGALHSIINVGYTNVVSTATTQKEIAGPQSTSKPGDQVTMQYIYNDSTGNYTQNISVNGKVVSTLSTNSGQALGWGTANECTTKPCGNVPAHSWINVLIIMNVTDPNYIRTAYPTGPGVTGAISTSDGGKTYTAAKLGIPAWDATTI